MPAIRRKTVLFPLPLGPMTALVEPAGRVRLKSSRGRASEYSTVTWLSVIINALRVPPSKPSGIVKPPLIGGTTDCCLFCELQCPGSAKATPRLPKQEFRMIRTARDNVSPVSYTHLRAHETDSYL